LIIGICLKFESSNEIPRMQIPSGDRIFTPID
jgi:hypothetical protein